MELQDICSYVKTKVETSNYSIEDYISTENMLPEKGGITVASSFPSGKVTEFQENDILISNIRPYFKKIWKADRRGCCSNDVLCIRANNNVDAEFLYYLLSQDLFFAYVMSGANGSKMPRGDKQQIMNWEIEIPSEKEDQRRIASILSSLDRKIELNNKINADLEEMAQAIFKNWFVDFEPFKDGKFVDSELGMIPEGWKVGRLTEIASYMNGLAMQKFPPENNEDSLPVLKIKELGQGFCGTDSDRCSCNIKDECKIHDGDVIFSWSGTLLVDVWCGGDCGLNQHLFKVTSKDYPKWFYYYWTKHHLREFIHIAKDKAVTMGHIKRGHLEEAMVAIPDNDSMEKAHELFEPILSKMISLRLESSRLSSLRDTLLPRLISGELEVPE
jgi:type I restriction modification DNA specificity domain protein